VRWHLVRKSQRFGDQDTRITYRNESAEAKGERRRIALELWWLVFRSSPSDIEMKSAQSVLDLVALLRSRSSRQKTHRSAAKSNGLEDAPPEAPSPHGLSHPRMFRANARKPARKPVTRKRCGMPSACSGSPSSEASTALQFASPLFCRGYCSRHVKAPVSVPSNGCTESASRSWVGRTPINPPPAEPVGATDRLAARGAKVERATRECASRPLKLLTLHRDAGVRA
jgi:hypothetical protein